MSPDAIACFLEAWGTHAQACGHPRVERGVPDRVRAEVRALLDDFRDELGGGKLIASLTRAAATLDRITEAVHWDDGLRDAIAAMIDRAVHEAERQFGPDTGAYKRQFVTDVVLEALSRDYLDVPLPTAMAAPFEAIVEMFISWTVEILNHHLGRTWYTEPTVKPTRRRTLAPSVQTQLRLYAALLRFWDWLSGLVLAPTRYDRRVRRARRALAPQVAALERLLPRDSLLQVTGDIARLIAGLGASFTPHIRTIERLIRFVRSERVRLGDRRGRRELLVAVLQELLGEAYADEPFLGSLIRSDLGAFLLRDLVGGAEVVLERNGLLPTDEPRALAATAT